MKITDARIGMKVATKNGYPMTITGIFTFFSDLGNPEEGTVYLDFEGNEGDVWEEDVKDVEPIKEKRPKNPWRKVSDEVPNDYQWVVAMVYHDDEQSLIMLDYILPNGKWRLNPQYTFTHWMPIPAIKED